VSRFDEGTRFDEAFRQRFYKVLVDHGYPRDGADAIIGCMDEAYLQESMEKLPGQLKSLQESFTKLQQAMTIRDALTESSLHGARRAKIRREFMAKESVDLAALTEAIEQAEEQEAADRVDVTKDGVWVRGASPSWEGAYERRVREAEARENLLRNQPPGRNF
jgi:hypothetical protein